MMGLCRLLLLAMSLTLCGAALAEKRVALVIGNAAYKHATPLANPRHDAEAIAAALKRLNFEVVEGFDLDEPATKRLLREFALKLENFGKADLALFFYSGHGLQVNGRNYLVPVDAKLERELDVDYQAVGYDLVQKTMERTPQTNIVILDACRDNPLARTLARGMAARSLAVGSGLAEIRGINDTLIIYATQPGNVALDGTEKNSPFTSALLKHMEEDGVEVRHMLAQVRQAVIADTQGKQVPWEAASLTRQIYLKSAPSRGVIPQATAEQETEFWRSIRDSKNPADYHEYRRRWPNGVFAELAKRRLDDIEKKPPPKVERAPGTVFRDCPECPEMVVIPAGSFTMGSPAAESQRRDDEGPQRRVTIAKPFALGKYEVTFAEWDACVAAGGCTYRPSDSGWGRGQRPVINVSWEDSKQYLAWLLRKTGKTYRLPSEAEWEFAARAGSPTRYFWGDEIGRNRANCDGCGSQWDAKQTAPVGNFAPNAFGLHDMLGNAMERVEDCYQNYAGAPSDGRPVLAGNCAVRVLRGGSRFSIPANIRSASRYGFAATVRSSNFGFRVALTLD
jgi:formylglycine-generating enzyme required for sulfatase activity